MRAKIHGGGGEERVRNQTAEAALEGGVGGTTRAAATRPARRGLEGSDRHILAACDERDLIILSGGKRYLCLFDRFGSSSSELWFVCFVLVCSTKRNTRVQAFYPYILLLEY